MHVQNKKYGNFEIGGRGVKRWNWKNMGEPSWTPRIFLKFAAQGEGGGGRGPDLSDPPPVHAPEYYWLER